MATRFEQVINEKSTFRYRAILRGVDGVVVPGAVLTSATLTLYTAPGEVIVNGRDAQNVLNTNNVTISGTGILIFSGQANDAVILDTQLNVEIHRAQFHLVWPGGEMRHEVDFMIRNLCKVT